MRWHGKLGYVDVEEENDDGIYTPIITEKETFGDQETKRMIVSTSTQPNGVIRSSMTLSVLVNPYLLKNYDRIAYATVNGVKWNVDSVDFVEGRRIRLQLGERYVDKRRISSGSQESPDSDGGSGNNTEGNWWE